MTTDNTEILLKLAGSLRDNKAQAQKRLVGSHWTYLVCGIRRFAENHGIQLKELEDADKARFVLEAGDEALVGIYRHIGAVTAKKLVAEAIEFLDQAHQQKIP
jgi:hypothetical protein